jgi:two-component system LytT family response regulator
MTKKPSYTALLIDDEQDCLEILNWHLETYCPDIRVLVTCDGAEEGLKSIHQLQPDLVFLDIEMPFLNGLELLSRVQKINFEVIFTTAYSEYALKALKLNALDYLLKPIVKDDFLQAVEKFKQRMAGKNSHSEASLQMLLQHLGAHHVQKKIAVPVQDSILFLEIESILYIKSESNYSYIHRRNGRPVLASKTLLHFEELLNDYHFVRIHASYLVNLSEITEYKKTEGGWVVMSDGHEIKVSRSRKDDLLKSL